MKYINEIEELSVIYTLCNYCIHKNKPLKVITKTISFLEIGNYLSEDIDMLIFNMGYNWDKKEKQWKQNFFHSSFNQNNENHSELPYDPVKLDFSLLDSEKELNVSSNDALTLLKNMANIQSTLNKILNHIKKIDNHFL